MKQLEGKKIFKIFINDEKDMIRFVDYENKNYDFYAEGDCCSYSWIEHIAGIAAMLDQTVLKVESIDMSHLDQDDHPKYDCLQVYGWKFKCAGGIMDLEFRNASNGYYGGWMDYVEKGFESWSSFKGEEDLKRLTGDF